MEPPTHYVASTTTIEIRSNAIGVGREYAGRTAGPAPDGVCHAAAPGAERTVCGIPVSSLITFEEQPWGQGSGVEWCPKCEAAVPL
jgi:hypothetical protein